jgi:hypothetical protein
MPIPPPLTCEQEEAVRERLKETIRRLQLSCAKNAPTLLDWYCGDVHRLLAEIARLQDQLSDAWLLLDEIARGRTEAPDALAAQRNAQALLRRQQAPGWKGQ